MVESLARLGKVARKVAGAKYITLCTWAILAAVGSIFAPKVIDATTVSVSAPHGYPSDTAIHAFQDYFPTVGVSADFAALIKCDAGCSNSSVVKLSSVANFVSGLHAGLKESLNEELLSFTSYFEMSELGVPSFIAKKQLVSPSGKATLVSWTVKGDGTKPAAREKAIVAQNLVAELRKKWLSDEDDDHVEILLAGQSLVINAAVTMGQLVMEHMDEISLPVAIVVSGCLVRSLRLMVIPLVLLGISLSISFAFLYAMSNFTVIESATPPMMMSLLIAMSFDYSLFICTRFREELGVRVPKAESLLEDINDPVIVAERVMDAIEATFSTAGFTVLLSGLTLISSFCILMCCPVDLVLSLGSGCAFALFVTLMAALTVPPAIFAAFPCFFAKARSTPPDTNRGMDFNEAVWTWIAKMTTRFPYNIIVILIVTSGTLFLASRALWIPGLEITDSLSLNVPYDTELARASTETADIFGKGKTLPYKLLLVPRNSSEGILSPSGVAWGKCISIIDDLIQNPKLHQTSSEDFNFAFFSDGMPISWSQVQPCLKSNPPGMCLLINKVIDRYVNKAGTAAYGYISLQWDPLSPKGKSWLKEIRQSLKKLGDENGFDLYLSGAGAEAWDMITQLYSMFPYIIAGSLMLAFLLLGIAFRSLVLPLRSILSILLTLGFVFGLAVASYEEGCFDWTGIHGISSQADGIFFFIPFLVFSVVMGICLDYDIFLLSRTVEVCEQTCDTQRAIQESFVATGGIITSAGTIMVIAFGGLMFSSMFILNQLGFFLACAAFYDTFVVRTLISPATTSLLGDWHWWPSPLFHKCRAAGQLALRMENGDAEASQMHVTMESQGVGTRPGGKSPASTPSERGGMISWSKKKIQKTNGSLSEPLLQSCVEERADWPQQVLTLQVPDPQALLGIRHDSDALLKRGVVLIKEVLPWSPSSKAGLRRGDIVEFIGSNDAVAVVKGGKSKIGADIENGTLKVLFRRPPASSQSDPSKDNAEREVVTLLIADPQAPLGIRHEPEVLLAHSIFQIKEVLPGSPSSHGGLHVGDIIEKIGSNDAATVLSRSRAQMNAEIRNGTLQLVVRRQTQIAKAATEAKAKEPPEAGSAKEPQQTEQAKATSLAIANEPQKAFREDSSQKSLTKNQEHLSWPQLVVSLKIADVQAPLEMRQDPEKLQSRNVLLIREVATADTHASAAGMRCKDIKEQIESRINKNSAVVSGGKAKVAAQPDNGVPKLVLPRPPETPEPVNSGSTATTTSKSAFYPHHYQHAGATTATTWTPATAPHSALPGQTPNDVSWQQNAVKYDPEEWEQKEWDALSTNSAGNSAESGELQGNSIETTNVLDSEPHSSNGDSHSHANH